MNRLSTVFLQRQDPSVLEDLQELVRALDRRVPRLDQTLEVSIAQDAAALRDRALERIARIETSEA